MVCQSHRILYGIQTSLYISHLSLQQPASPLKPRVRHHGKPAFIHLIFFLGTSAAAPIECGKGRPHKLDCQPLKGRVRPMPPLWTQNTKSWVTVLCWMWCHEHSFPVHSDPPRGRALLLSHGSDLEEATYLIPAYVSSSVNWGCCLLWISLVSSEAQSDIRGTAL